MPEPSSSFVSVNKFNITNKKWQPQTNPSSPTSEATVARHGMAWLGHAQLNDIRNCRLKTITKKKQKKNNNAQLLFPVLTRCPSSCLTMCTTMQHIHIPLDIPATPFLLLLLSVSLCYARDQPAPTFMAKPIIKKVDDTKSYISPRMYFIIHATWNDTNIPFPFLSRQISTHITLACDCSLIFRTRSHRLVNVFTMRGNGEPGLNVGLVERTKQKVPNGLVPSPSSPGFLRKPISTTNTNTHTNTHKHTQMFAFHKISMNPIESIVGPFAQYITCSRRLVKCENRRVKAQLNKTNSCRENARERKSEPLASNNGTLVRVLARDKRLGEWGYFSSKPLRNIYSSGASLVACTKYPMVCTRKSISPRMRSEKRGKKKNGWNVKKKKKTPCS